MYRGGAETAFTIGNTDKPLHGAETDPASRFLDASGKLGSDYAKWTHNHITKPTLDAVGDALPGKTGANFLQWGQENGEFLSNTFTKYQYAYLPYMFVKNETAGVIDTQTTDAAIYQMLDGITEINPAKVMQGANNIVKVATLQPVSEELQAHIGEHRGLVNSRHETSCRNTQKQEDLKVARHKAPPSSTVSDAAHEGQTVAANNITTFKRPVMSDGWKDYQHQRESQAEAEPALTYSRN